MFTLELRAMDGVEGGISEIQVRESKKEAIAIVQATDEGLS